MSASPHLATQVACILQAEAHFICMHVGFKLEIRVRPYVVMDRRNGC